MRIWFFLVVIISLGIAFNAFIYPFSKYSSIIALIIALPLAFYKTFKRNFLVHNLTELLIYPGIAAVFVPLLGIFSLVIILLLISIYDLWAVWHSGIMQKMAKYQINEVKIFAGFFVPYLDKKQKALVQKLKQKNQISKLKNIKVNTAILGGGDVVFPIIASGVVLRAWGLIPALAVTLCASISLVLLFIFAKKKKFYPAMPFITAGIFAGMILGYLFTLI